MVLNFFSVLSSEVKEDNSEVSADEQKDKDVSKVGFNGEKYKWQH